MAINNPYVPGDPFSYDLKWLVRKIKEHQIILDGLDERIQNAIIAALENLDQLGPKYFESAADLISSDLKDKSIAYIEGFFAPGDGGANLYYVTTDYNDIIGADFYLTLDGPNRWALPIIVTPYVMPEMFGAYGDGIEDDTEAMTVFAKQKKTHVGNGTYSVTESLAFDPGYDIDVEMILSTVKDDFAVKIKNPVKKSIRINISGDAYNGNFDYTGLSNTTVFSSGGIQIENPERCTIKASAFSFASGVQILGTGAAVNNVITVHSDDCVIGLDAISTGSGYVNSNKITDCYFHNSSDNPHYSDNFAMRIYGAGSNSANTNHITDSLFEQRGHGAVLIKANFNWFDHIRTEGASVDYWFDVVSGLGNVFRSGYGQTLTNTAPSANTMANLVQAEPAVLDEMICKTIDYYVDGHKMAAYTNGGSYRAFYADFDIVDASPNTFKTAPDFLASNATITSTSFGTSSGLLLGRLFKISPGAIYRINVDSDDASTRAHVIFYNASMSAITLTDANCPVIFGKTRGSFHNNDKNLRTNAANHHDITCMCLDSNAVYMFVGVRGSLSHINVSVISANSEDILQMLPPCMLKAPSISNVSYITEDAMLDGSILPLNDTTAKTDSNGTYYYSAKKIGGTWKAFKQYTV